MKSRGRAREMLRNSLRPSGSGRASGLHSSQLGASATLRPQTGIISDRHLLSQGSVSESASETLALLRRSGVELEQALKRRRCIHILKRSGVGGQPRASSGQPASPPAR